MCCQHPCQNPFGILLLASRVVTRRCENFLQCAVFVLQDRRRRMRRRVLTTSHTCWTSRWTPRSGCTPRVRPAGRASRTSCPPSCRPSATSSPRRRRKPRRPASWSWYASIPSTYSGPPHKRPYTKEACCVVSTLFGRSQSFWLLWPMGCWSTQHAQCSKPQCEKA